MKLTDSKANANFVKLTKNGPQICSSPISAVGVKFKCGNPLCYSITVGFEQAGKGLSIDWQTRRKKYGTQMSNLTLDSPPVECCEDKFVVRSGELIKV